MRYAKLINDYPYYAPHLLRIREMWIYNPTETQLFEAGYMPLIETDPPETDAQHYVIPLWKEKNGNIVQTWEVINAEESDEATEADYISALSSVGVSI